MALAITRIILVSRNVQFAIDVKRALEALGEYSVTAAADVRNAIEEIRENPQHVLLLDTTNLSIAPAMMMDIVRSRQKEIAIVLAPDNPETRELARVSRAKGIVDIPVMARDLIPVLNEAMGDFAEALPQAQATPTIDVGEDTIYIESLVNDLLEEDLALNYTRRRLQASYELLNPSGDAAAETTARNAFELLIEPDEEGDTVHYRVVTVEDTYASPAAQLDDVAVDETPIAGGIRGETVGDLAHSLTRDEDFTAERKDTAAEPEASGLQDSADFEEMLSAVLDESTQLENLTLESLFDTTRELPGALGTGVVPAWLRQTEQFIREPGFLSELAVSLPPVGSPVEAGETTMPVEPAIPAFEDVVAERETALDDETEESSVPPAADSEAREPLSDDPARAPLWSRNSDPVLAQLAVTMTQMMTDLTADATVLTRGNQIVAFSGEMPLERFRALRRMIADDWMAADSQSRIRFVTLPESGTDYMLYSRGSVAEHTLTMIFSGGRPLRDIRRQGDRMRQALDAAPAGDAPVAASEESLSPSATETRQPFAFVWLVDDPARLLRKPVAEQLVFWLEVQLNGLNWKIHRLDVHHDFIYLRADVPGNASPDSLVRAVMERARLIARSEDAALPRDLWADAYLVLQPGRDMSERELQRFLQFARA
ncbi:MAG: hypothetical protein OXI77_14220 [Chloroflexota bacterium]|nr:hypothetical protein [Chloroflexota bacterium]MDE2909974.1 hypothetical protein [Chloroflexota bacterium]